MNALEEQNRTWTDVHRALCHRFGLKSREWFVEHGKVTRYRYWVTLCGREGKRIKTRGIVRELWPEASA